MRRVCAGGRSVPSSTQSHWNAPRECSSVAPSTSTRLQHVAERGQPLGPKIAERPSRRRRQQATTGYWVHREADAEGACLVSEVADALDRPESPTIARVEEHVQPRMRTLLVDGEEVQFRRSWYGAVRGRHDEFNEHSLAHRDLLQMRNTVHPVHNAHPQPFEWAAFDVAVEYVSSAGRAAFDKSMHLKLYGLHQQAVIGDVMGTEPADVEGNEQRKARWAAWAANAGTSKLEAREAYVAMVKAVCPTFKVALSQHQGGALLEARGSAGVMGESVDPERADIKGAGLSMTRPQRPVSRDRTGT